MRKISTMLVLVGILAIILSFIEFFTPTGYYENYYSYEGDAYTGIQNAAATTALNVTITSEIIKFGFGSLLLVIGLTLEAAAMYFSYLNKKENELSKAKKVDETPLPKPMIIQEEKPKTVPVVPALPLCPHCESKIPENAIFCTKCGTRVK